MSQTEWQEADMEFDHLHALENFVDIYDNQAEMVVYESISNSIDAGAKNIEIKTGTDSGDYSVSFLDDGPGMDKSQFSDYQVCSRSTKDKKFGLGFAGIGSKLYVGKNHGAKIITETFNGQEQLACAFYVKDGKIKTCQRKPMHKFTRPGTFYEVILSQNDHYYIEDNLKDILVDTFNHAMLDGLKITINNNKIKPWNPPATEKRTGTVYLRSIKLRYHFYLFKDDFPQHWKNLNYQIMGKTISKKKLEFINELKAEYHQKIYVSVDALPLKSYLKTDKSSFSRGFHEYHHVVNKEIYSIAKQLGLLSNSTPNKLINNVLTKAFAELFNDPKYAWLNPHTLFSRRTGGGGHSGGHSGGHGGCSGVKRPRTLRGFAVVLSDSPKDKREGWLEIQNNAVAINVGHPIHIQFETVTTTLQYHYARVIVSILVLHGSEQKSMTLKEAIELQTEILTKVKDKLWL